MTNMLLLLVHIGVINALPPPLYRWPLNKLTCGKEVEATKDAIEPKLEDCVINKPGTVTVGSTTISKDGFVKFSPPQTHIDVEITNNVNISSFGFSILINPTVTSGTVVHYKASVPIPGEIAEFKFQFVTNRLLITLDDHTSRYERDYNIYPNIFSLVGCGFRYSDKKAFFFTRNSASGQSNSNFGRGLTVPGILRFGALQTTTPSDMFNGKIACALFFNELVSVYDEQNTKLVCGEDYIDATTPEPHLIWPLDSNYKDQEISTERLPLIQPDYRFTYGPPDLPNEAVLFDGSKLTSLQLDGISNNLLANHHSFGMYIYVEDHNNVTLMTIKSAAGDVMETQISVDGTSVKITLLNRFGSKCGDLFESNILQLNTWFVLGFKITFPSNMVLLVNGSEYLSSHACGNPQTSSTNYSIRLGYSEEENEGFHGRMRCLVLVDDLVQMTEVLNVACNDTVSIPETELVVPSERERYSIISKTNSKPLSFLPVMGYIDQSTLLNCGRRCIEERYCRSFTFQSTGQCTLYDFVVFKSLTSISGANYYIVK